MRHRQNHHEGTPGTLSSGSVPSGDVWDRLGAAIAAADRYRRYAALCGIAHGIHLAGPGGSLAIQDPTLWETMVMLIDRFPQVVESDVAMRDLILFLFTHASPDDRRWMWEILHRCWSESSDPVRVRNRQDICRFIPPALVPDVVLVLMDMIRSGRSDRAFPVIEDWYRDPKTRSLAQSALLSIWADTTLPLRVRLTAAYILIHHDPAIFITVPEMATQVYQAGTGHGAHGADIAIQIIRRAAPPEDWRLVGEIARQSSTADRAAEAAVVMCEMARRSAEPDALSDVVASCVDMLHAPTTHAHWHVAAAYALTTMLRWSPRPPALDAWLRDLPTNAYRIPPTFWVILVDEGWPDDLTEMMIGVAATLPDDEIARSMLSRSWGRGQDAYVFHILGHRLSLSPNKEPILPVLRRGVCSSVGTPVRHCIIQSFPDAIAVSALALGIAEWVSTQLEQGAPIMLPDPALIEDIAMAVTITPDAVRPEALLAVWETDPTIAHDLTRTLARQSSTVQCAMTALASRWGHNDDDIVAIIDHMLSTVSDPHIPTIAEAVVEGIGYGDADTLVQLWNRIVQRCSVHQAVQMVDGLAATWRRGNPHLTLAFLDTLCNRSDLGLRVVPPVASVLHYGWGVGVDAEIVDRLSRMVTQTCSVWPFSYGIDGVDILDTALGAVRDGWDRGYDAELGRLVETVIDWRVSYADHLTTLQRNRIDRAIMDALLGPYGDVTVRYALYERMFSMLDS